MANFEVKKFAAGSRQLLMTIKVTPTHKAPGATVHGGDLKCGACGNMTLVVVFVNSWLYIVYMFVICNIIALPNSHCHY